MWLLRDSSGNIKYLKPNKIINVGRKQADIILENDSSISRDHATITVTLKDQMTTSEKSSICIVKDAKSKYGTIVTRNNILIKANTEGLELQPFDTLRFGLQQHIFIVEYIHFITVVSRLSADHKKQMKEIMNNIGGIIIDYYDDNCTHLTTTTAQSTNKIISALIAGLPIIDINYWIAVEKAIGTDDNLPDPNQFTLQLQDKGVNTQRVSLKPNLLRKVLFQGKTFFFFSEKTYREYKNMIKEAGGKAKLEPTNSNDIRDELTAVNNIIMQITDDTITNELAVFNAMLYDKMQEKKLRMIAETEIPLAIVYVSLDQYCNPNYHFKELMKRKSLNKDTSEILALDTQDIGMLNINVEASTTKLVQIPETDDFLQDDVPHDVIEANIISKVNIKQTDDGTNNDIFPKSENLEVNIQNAFLGNMVLRNEAVDKQITNECPKSLSSGTNQNFDGIDFKCMSNKQISISIKQSLESGFEDSHNKKRHREQSAQSDNKNNENVHSGWKNKERVSPFGGYVKKKKSVVSTGRDDFIELGQQKIEIKEKKKNKLSKWGFKKSERKARDFDLDDLDIGEPLEQIEKNIIKHSIKTSGETESSEKTSKTKNTYDLSLDNKVGGNIQIKSFDFNNSKLLKENIKAWTLTGLLQSENYPENCPMMKNENSLLVRPNIKLESSECTKNDGKAFRKVHNRIPQKRIALSEMRIWRPKS